MSTTLNIYSNQTTNVFNSTHSTLNPLLRPSPYSFYFPSPLIFFFISYRDFTGSWNMVTEIFETHTHTKKYTSNIINIYKSLSTEFSFYLSLMTNITLR